MPFTIPKNGFSGFKGYVSNPQNADPHYLSLPSQNCLVTDDGIAESRLGYTKEFSIGVSGSPATSFFHETYDIAFFALGTKLYYRDYNTGTTVDTGITLTAGTTTRFEEINGDVVLTNTTDGVKRFCVGRLNDSAANAGDGTFVVELDFYGRMAAFGDAASSINLRINGTDEAITGIASDGTVTHATTLSQSYPNNSIVLYYDNSHTGLDKFSKLLLWKHRLHGMGFPSASNADQPNNAVLTGKYIVGQTGAAGIEDVLSFPLDGTLGSVKIAVLGGGSLTNILGVADNIYFFTERRAFATAAADISTSGSTLGLTIPIEKSTLHGCLNEDCAVVMGENAIGVLTPENRIVRIPIDTDTGAALSAPEEDFDNDIEYHLSRLSKNQTGAFSYHYRGGRQTIWQLKEAGEWKWFIFDHNIVRQVGSNFVKGAWQPPQRVVPVKSLFERDGVLWGTDMFTDNVYSFFTSFLDDTSPIYTIIATGEFDVGSAQVKKASCKGDISYPAKIKMRCYVWNNTRGKTSGSEKTVLGSAFGYSEDESVGALPVGGSGTGETMNTAKWQKEFDVFPSEATRTQLILTNDAGGYCSLSSYSLTGDQYSGFSASL